MKNFALIFLLILPFFTFSQNEKKMELTSKISSVVVFLNAAEITRSEKIQFSSGRTRLIFRGLSPNLVYKSIRVNAKSGVSILSISSKKDYLSDIAENPRVKQLRDSLEILEDRNIALISEKEAYATEKELLKTNISIGGENKGVVVTELKEAAEFYRTRVLDINKKVAGINKETKSITLKTSRLIQELKELNAELIYIRSEVEVLVSTEKSLSSEINIKYLISDAGWAPHYELRTNEVGQEIELIYRAKVYNNSKINWSNTKIKLSTGDPNLSAVQPRLKPWYVNQGTTTYNSQVSNLNIANNSFQWSGTEGNDISQQQAISYNEFQPGSTAVSSEYQEVEVSELSVEFEIKSLYTIPSDNKPYLVDVAEHKLPATFKHYAVPKMGKDAYLLARISGWSDINLIEGPANIYFSGSYIGQSYIHTRNVRDTLDISLGRDKKVMVTRTKLKKFSSNQFFGSKQEETFAYQMVVKNNHKKAITIDVFDQLPISQHDDIKVKAIETTDAVLIEDTQKLKWTLVLEPNQSKDIRLTYSIKHPKTVKIQKTRKRNVQMRKF